MRIQDVVNRALKAVTDTVSGSFGFGRSTSQSGESSAIDRYKSVGTLAELASQPGGNRAVLAIANEITAALRSIQQPISASHFGGGQARDERGRFVSGGGGGQDFGDSVSDGARLGSVRDDATAARSITAAIGEAVRRTFPNAGFAIRPGQGVGGSQVPSGAGGQSADAPESMLSRLMGVLNFTGGHRAPVSAPDVFAGGSLAASGSASAQNSTAEAAENLETASESLMDSAAFLESLLSASKTERTSGAGMLGRGFNDAADGFVSRIDDYLARIGQPGRQSTRDRLTGRPDSPGMFQPLTRRLAVGGRRKLRNMFGRRLQRHSMRMASGGSAGGAGAFGGGFGRFMAGMFGGGGGGGSAAGAAGGGAAGGGAGGAAGGGAAAAAGSLAVAGMVVGVIAFVGAIAAAAKGLYELGQQGYETALRVAEYDAALYGAKTQLEISRMFRDMKTANSLSDNGAKFMDSLNNLEETVRPITDFLQNHGLELLTAITNVVNALIKTAAKVDDAGQGILDRIKANPAEALLGIVNPIAAIQMVLQGGQQGIANGAAAAAANAANQANANPLPGGGGFGRLREMFEQANGMAPPPAPVQPPRAPIPPIGGGGGMKP